MITQMMAANGFLDGIVSRNAGITRQGDSVGQNLFSSLLTKAGSSIDAVTPGVTKAPEKAASYVDQLKSRLLRSGAALEEVTLEPEAENHVRALLLLDGYSPEQVEEIMADFGKNSAGMTASELFSRISRLEPEDAILQQSRTLEVSAIPHLEKALFLAGLDAEQSQAVINDSLSADGKISMKMLVQNLKQVVGDEDQSQGAGLETALEIMEALNAAGIEISDQAKAPTTLKELLGVLQANSFEDVSGLPKITRERLLSHLKGVTDNAFMEDEDGEGLVPLSKLTESKLKFIDEEDFEGVPVVYVEMALRRMGVDPSEAGRLASQISSAGEGKGRILVKNLGAAEKFKESLPRESVPAFERLIREMAANGELTKNEITVTNLSQVFASMDVEEAMEGLSLKGSDELETLAALLSQSLEADGEDGVQTALYAEKKSVPQTLVELRDLLQGLANNGKTLPEAAAKDLAAVLKQSGADATLVDDLIVEAKIAEGEVDSAKLTKSMERVAQSVLLAAIEEAGTRIDTANKSAELSRKFVGVMQVLQNTRNGFLSEEAAQYVAKALEDMGADIHEFNQALSQNRFPSRGVDPVPVIQVIKNIAAKMGIDSETIVNASIQTGVQDPDAVVSRVKAKSQAFGFTGRDDGENKLPFGEVMNGKAENKAASAAVYQPKEKSSEPVAAQMEQSASKAEKGTAVTIQDSDEPVVSAADKSGGNPQVSAAENSRRDVRIDVKAPQANAVQNAPEETLTADEAKIAVRGGEQADSVRQAKGAQVQAEAIARLGATADAEKAGQSSAARLGATADAEKAGQSSAARVSATADAEKAGQSSAARLGATADAEKAGQSSAARVSATADTEKAGQSAAFGALKSTEAPKEMPKEAPGPMQGVQQAQKNAGTAQDEPEVIIRGADRVHNQGLASSGASQTGPAQVKTVENVAVENRDGQRVQVRSNDVYVQAPANANADEVEQAQTAVKTAAGLRADLGASQAVREARTKDGVQANHTAGAQSQGQKTGEAGQPIQVNAQGDAAVDPESEFGDALQHAAARKNDAGVSAQAREEAPGGEIRTFAKLAASDKGVDAAETQAVAGKGSAASQTNEAQAASQSFQQEPAQASRTSEAAPQRPVLRPYEGQMAQQLGSQVVQALNRRDNRIRLQLHPQQLGKVDVNLNLKKNVLSVGMSAETEAVKEILISHVSELKNALADQGIVVDKIEVNVRQNPEQNLAQQQQGQGQGRQAGNRGSSFKGGQETPEGFVGMNPPKYETESGLNVVA
ncbi:Large adhesion/ Putative flagellar hook-length control protein (putative FliK) [Desulfatibacillum aliphaticivorans]|uniref:Large adhesion/ Putative flagellar hook-length control protein (Putative FliK) n=1 Tax=Desulfatibacillum aliphaticivorans TaxID=218208 RepID=B8FK45_DESAL|nr:flagellar hook-length control protein FliK [Desulfatibacillum aliphaticivorans]ACL02720.1 Large adhesion/ Putative flagellar hook-length control protein (putative FliK) [Desulfatibacillum aliphaticivorans]